MISYNFKSVEKFFSEDDYDNYLKRALPAFNTLINGSGDGNDFLGWIKLPSSHGNEELFKRCKILQSEWDNLKIESVVVIGIGGSYLGAEAAIKALSPAFGYGVNKFPEVLFAGNNLSEDYLFELCNYLKEKNFAIVVVSKSGTTTEPAVAFRLLREQLIKTYGDKQSAKRIVAITDASKGALKKEADEKGYVKFIIPDDVGGRFSVLTAVGIVPFVLAGYDAESLLAGAKIMEEKLLIPDRDNIALRYASLRNAMYESGKEVEILVNFNPRLRSLGEWWKQLYGESEGKEGKGLFPASANFTTDLHSLGQYIQQGKRILFETMLIVKNSCNELCVKKEEDNSDELNYLAGKRIDEINRMAQLGTMVAHSEGGVPVSVIEIDRVDEFNIGELFYFFEFACGISGYILGVNPFNQPGVEGYKKNMFALLGKEGYKDLYREIMNKI